MESHAEGGDVVIVPEIQIFCDMVKIYLAGMNICRNFAADIMSVMACDPNAPTWY